MLFRSIPPSLLQLITTILLAPHTTFAKPHPASSANAGFAWNELFARYDCSGQVCGFYGQLCCTAGDACYTDTNNEAQCGPTSAGYVPAATSHAAGGYWQYYTSIFTETDTVLTTQIYSTYIVPQSTYAPAASSAAARCNYALNESPCGNICCASNQYCASWGKCAAAYAGQTTTTTVSASATAVAIPPVRGASSSYVVVTKTQSPTVTVPFETPVQTGANVTFTETHVNNGGLSGGAIAGIVIGVLLGIALLALICFYCCIKGLLDGCLALFGFGKKRRNVTEVDEYERRTHHSSGGGRRTWYGASRPNRPARRKESSNVGKEAAGIFAGLAGLWAILGLKRRHDRKKEDDKYTEYSYSSDYYTSASG